MTLTEKAMIACDLSEQLDKSYVHKFVFQMTCQQLDVIKIICKEKNIRFEELTYEDILIYYKEND